MLPQQARAKEPSSVPKKLKCIGVFKLRDGDCERLALKDPCNLYKKTFLGTRGCLEGSRQIKRSMQDLYLIASFDKFGYKVEPCSLEKQVVQGEREISICCAKMQGEIRVTTQGGASPCSKRCKARCSTSSSPAHGSESSDTA